MAEYERINFRKKWFQEVEQYLEDNPDLGFEPEDAKYFIKQCVKKEMSKTVSEDEKIARILKKIKNQED